MNDSTPPRLSDDERSALERKIRESQVARRKRVIEGAKGEDNTKGTIARLIEAFMDCLFTFIIWR